MSFLIHSDEHGWLRAYDYGYAQNEARPYWDKTRQAAYRFQNLHEAVRLKLPNVGILEERDQ